MAGLGDLRAWAGRGLEGRALEWGDIPEAARETAGQLGLREEQWPQWLQQQGEALAARVLAGSAEHVIYYALQSRAFTKAAPLDPTRCAATDSGAVGVGPTVTEEVRARMEAFVASPMNLGPEVAGAVAGEVAGERFSEAMVVRHRLVRQLYERLRAEGWSWQRAYRETMEFLQAKEIRREALEPLYLRRGLSSDTAPESTQGLGQLPQWLPEAPSRILLVGPGLDLTRRQEFADGRPVISHQQQALARLFPKAEVTLADVRPEVLTHLSAQAIDITTQTLAGEFDVVIATNLLLYFDLPQLLTAMVACGKALRPGGHLLHNDQRFAAKHFGQLTGLPAKRFVPVELASASGREATSGAKGDGASGSRPLGTRRRPQQMDRIVLHQRVAS